MPNSRTLAVLVLVNAVLVAALSVTLAQPGGADAPGAPGETRYLMIAGEAARGGPTDAIYIINTETGDILLARYDSRTDELRLLDGRNILVDLGEFIEPAEPVEPAPR